MRRAAKIDGNQPAIVETLRAAGCSVTSTSAVGNGFPDLIVGRALQNFALEVKDPSQPPCKRRLTPDQAVWHSLWAGQVAIVETPEQALRAVGL